MEVVEGEGGMEKMMMRWHDTYMEADVALHVGYEGKFEPFYLLQGQI